MACHRSMTLAGCLLAALIEGHPGCKLSYQTIDLKLGHLMEWIRARLGVSQQLIQEHVTITPVLDQDSKNNPVGGINSTYDFLYRGTLYEANELNEPRKFGAYAFFAFYKKTTIRVFKGGPTTYYPRATLSPGHPQASTHCLMRRDPPRIPLLKGRRPRMPADWKEADQQNPQMDYNDEGHINWALYVLALFYPVTMSQELTLSGYGGNTLYTQVRNWWRATYPTGEFNHSRPCCTC